MLLLTLSFLTFECLTDCLTFITHPCLNCTHCTNPFFALGPHVSTYINSLNSCFSLNFALTGPSAKLDHLLSSTFKWVLPTVSLKPQTLVISTIVEVLQKRQTLKPPLGTLPVFFFTPINMVSLFLSNQTLIFKFHFMFGFIQRRR